MSPVLAHLTNQPIHLNTSQHDDPEAVWLVDHAWTFLCSQKPTRQLARHPSLLQRMAALAGLNDPPSTASAAPAPAESPDPARVMRELWRQTNTYKLSGVPGFPSDEPIWYVMDEFGARIGHAPRRERQGAFAGEKAVTDEEEGDDDDDGPTLGMTPFFFQPEGCMYSVLWPLRDMDYGDEATRGESDSALFDWMVWMNGCLVPRMGRRPFTNSPTHPPTHSNITHRLLAPRARPLLPGRQASGLLPRRCSARRSAPGGPAQGTTPFR